MSSPVRLGPEDARVFKRVLDTFKQLDRKEDLVAFLKVARTGPGVPALVVAGEIKRGKSTLVNALVGRAVSPAGPETSTAGFVAVVPPTEDLPEGTARLVCPDGPRPVALEDVADALDLGGSWAELQPRGVEVALAGSWVTGAALVDSPGVGGLGAEQGVRARTVVAGAAALVFVTDGGQVLTRPELDFLREISEATAHVVFVLTKIDRNPGDWEVVRDENRALLRQHAPRFADAPVYPVSAAMALHAQALPEDQGARLLDASGIPELAGALQSIADRSDLIGLVNALQFGRTCLERARAEIELRMRASGDVRVLDALVAEQARLAELKVQQRKSRMEIEREFQRLRRSVNKRINEACDDLTDRMAVIIRAEKWGMSDAAHAQFVATLTTELGVIADSVRTDVGAELVLLLERVFGSATSVPDSIAPHGLSPDLELLVRTRPTFSMNPLLDPGLAGSAFMGSSLARMLGSGGLVGLVLGGGMLALNVFVRGRRTGQQELAGTLQETTARARQDLKDGVDSWFGELRPEVYIAVEDAIAESIAGANAIINEVRESQKLTERERQIAAKGLEKDLQEVDDRLGELEARINFLKISEHSALEPPRTG